MNMNSIRWVAAIVDRGKGNKAASIFQEHNVNILLAVRGHGTAGSAIMDCLGLDEPEKDLVLGVTSKAESRHVMEALKRTMEFHKPGHGIVCSIPLSGITIGASGYLNGGEPVQSNTISCPKEDTPMPLGTHYELIAAVIHTDLSAPVMEAAKKAGCHGGTLVKAREMGSDEEKKIFGLTLSPEKAILLILTPDSGRQPILKAICETVLHETGEHAVAFSLPVDAVEGITG